MARRISMGYHTGNPGKKQLSTVPIFSVKKMEFWVLLTAPGIQAEDILKLNGEKKPHGTGFGYFQLICNSKCAIIGRDKRISHFKIRKKNENVNNSGTV